MVHALRHCDIAVMNGTGIGSNHVNLYQSHAIWQIGVVVVKIYDPHVVHLPDGPQIPDQSMQHPLVVLREPRRSVWSAGETFGGIEDVLGFTRTEGTRCSGNRCGVGLGKAQVMGFSCDATIPMFISASASFLTFVISRPRTDK